MSDLASARGLALIIGNAAYAQINRIDDAADDATLFSQTMRSLGVDIFKGQAQLNLDHAALDDAVARFIAQAAQLSANDFVVVYFKGHGTRRNGVSYLLPVDARPNEDLYGLDWNASVVGALEHIPMKAKLVFIDACDNETGNGADSLGRPTVIPANTLISYSTQPDRKALTPSPYSKSLADHAGDPGVRIEDVLTVVQGEVMRQRPSQVPASYGSAGDFAFRPASTVTITSHDPDDVVTVFLDDKAVLSANIDQAHKAVTVNLPLTDVSGRITVYNKKSRRNNQFWQPYEGWRYHIVIESAGKTLADMSGSEDSLGNTCDRHCDKTFDAGSFVLRVNRKTAAVALVRSDPDVWKH